MSLEFRIQFLATCVLSLLVACQRADVDEAGQALAGRQVVLQGEGGDD